MTFSPWMGGNQDAHDFLNHLEVRITVGISTELREALIALKLERWLQVSEISPGELGRRLERYLPGHGEVLLDEVRAFLSRKSVELTGQDNAIYLGQMWRDDITGL